MLQNDESLDLITRYLNNPSDQSLLSEITAFRSESSEQEAYFLEIEKIWNYSASAAKLEEIDVINSSQKIKSSLEPVNSKKSQSRLWLGGVAASLLIALAGYWMLFHESEPIYLVKTTAKNQIDSVKLADGSIIILAENSELKYPEKFNSLTRDVFLTNGQAFFKIAKDKEHPFKVSINESKVVVLGTSFNIKLTDSSIVLGVKTGKVLFSPYETGKTSVLTPGQSVSYNSKTKKYITKTADNQDSWLTKELVFVDTPLEEVCKQLSNYFGVEIKLQNNMHTAKKLNAKFTDQSLENVLSVLNETYNIKIKREHDQINLITPKQIN